MPHQNNNNVKLVTDWFIKKGWHLYPHQLAVLKASRNKQSTLLIAPTGGGKTLAGFLPTLVDLVDGYDGLHTIYISPLKALTADVQRNLLAPIEDLKLPITVEIRTGDTSSSRKKRQFKKPPNILLTTPESLELLLSYADALPILHVVKRIIIDEVHALAPGKRGHLAALCIGQLRHLNPDITITGLSATVAQPERLADWMGGALIIKAVDTVKPKIHMMQTEGRVPWGGYMATYAVNDIYKAIQKAQTAIVFVNTRAQAEWLFQQLWLKNEDNLPIGLHHGSLDRDHRKRVEKFMSEGGLRAIVATASLDLGLDWGAVDLVIQVGAPKGISRLLQRIGRSNHRYNEPSEALLVPTNRFEMLECIAVMQAIAAGERDGEPLHEGSLDVLTQFVLNCACAAPFDENTLYKTIQSVFPYRHVTWDDFQSVIACVAHGGYVLTAYERFQRIVRDDKGLWHAVPQAIRRHRMNTGTIVEYETIPVGLMRGRSPHPKNLGMIEEFFIQGLSPGDTFLFGGQMLRFIGVRDNRVMAERGKGARPKIPSFQGGKLPLSLALAERVLGLLEHHEDWTMLPSVTREWLQLQVERSELPCRTGLLVESFPHEKLFYTVLYSFAGRNANQTLGLLLTHAMEQQDLLPLGFVASDYALAIWGLRAVKNPQALIHNALEVGSIDEWIERSQMSKRAFREIAIIAGLVERNYAGKRKTGRQVTVSTDLIYEVLLRHEPHHILLRATRNDVETRIADIERLNQQLKPLPIRFRALEKPSPLAIPLLLEIGIERIKGKGEKELLSIQDIELRRDQEGDRLLKKSKAVGVIINFANQNIELLPEGAVWFPDHKLLCASDLHFEKGSFFARAITFLPPYDTRETLQKLQRLIRHYKPETFVAVGDSFHDKKAVERMEPESLLALNQLVKTVPEWHWLAGNHDVALPSAVMGLAGTEIFKGGVAFRHQTENKDECEISGHYHPKARLYVRKHYITAPCFVRYRNRIILPAFGKYTGGLNVNSRAFETIAPFGKRELFLTYHQNIFPRTDE